MFQGNFGRKTLRLIAVYIAYALTGSFDLPYKADWPYKASTIGIKKKKNSQETAEWENI